MKKHFCASVLRILVFSGIIITALITCEKPERVVQFTTLEAQTADVSYTTATLKGEITDAGSKPIGDHGILISTDANPRVGNSTVKSLGSRSSKGVFSANVTDLTKNTTYYFRSYVTIEGVDTYAEKICSFTTLDTQPPTVAAGTISALTMTSASLNGEVTSDGGETATARGLCWGSEANPTITNCIDTTKNGSGTGVFTGSMTSLTPGTQYYVRTYATNSKGTSYNSADIVFTTHNLPVVTTASVTVITETTATSGGEVTDEGGVNVTARGVCWGTTTGPTVDLTTKTSDGTGVGAFVSSVTGLTQGTLYYLRAYATNQYGTSYGSETSFTTASSTDAPIAVTGAAGAVASTSALLQGTVNANGYSTTVTFEYGSTTSYGTEVAADQSPVTGTTETAVNVGVTGLTASTTYHYRVKAVSTGGTTYGDDMEFTTATTLPTVTDYDGTTYNIITINTQDWIQENLKTTHYNNGEAIANITTDDTAWETLTTGAYCWYNNDEATYKNTYGALYNWYTTVDVRNVCPAGWHVPTDAEWTTLVDYLGGVNNAGALLKETGTTHWTDPNSGATNESYFTALPGGQRRYDGPFSELGDEGYWWTSTVYSTTSAWWRLMEYNNTQANHYASNNNFGFSVRCIKGELPLTKIDDATTIAATSATFNGQVNPNNASTTVTFEYGETTSYGSEITASESPVTGSTPASVSADISSLSESTTYHYRVKAVNSYGTSYSADMTFTTLTLTAPTATTGSAISVTTTSATLNGTVNANDLSTTVTFEYGLTTTYGTEVTAAESPVTGTTATAVSYNLSSLTASTTYHYRVKAVSTGGTTYGDDMEFTTATALPTVSDYDGNEYNIITIGTQEWIQENLKTTHYNNGEIIANITDNTEWSGLTTGAYCWYDNDEGTYKDTYGALYNWYTTVDVRNVCPAGWHVPSDAEWSTMENYLIANGYNYDGTTTENKIAKSLAATTNWAVSSNTGAVGNTDYPEKRNATGFTALPGGSRGSNGAFGGVGGSGVLWSATENDASDAWIRVLYYSFSNVSREYGSKKCGFSVRCVRD